MAYKYLFFRLYKFASSLSYDTTPHFTAIITISSLICLNFASISNVADHFNIILLFFQNAFTTIIFSIIILITNIILIYKVIGIASIEKQFSTQKKDAVKKSNVFTIVYI